MVNGMRKAPIEENEIKSLFPFFPPRSLFEIEVNSIRTNRIIKGKYIETFITPDNLLGAGHTKENFKKVYNAALVAIKHQAPITTLGGFTSIFLEGDLDLLPINEGSKFTTGNTLTSAFIAKGIMDACSLLNIDLSKSNFLILGATGDIGSACANYFKGRVKSFFFVSRNQKKLHHFCEQFNGCRYEASCNASDFISKADIILAATSSREIELLNPKSTALIVDAGYPKNLLTNNLNVDAHLFYGGMGIVKGGYTSTPDYHRHFYQFPYAHMAHGCVLEAMVLAFEGRCEEYSNGRGKITGHKMDEILAIAAKHGIECSPFYNDKGPWPSQITKNAYDEK